MTQDIIFKIADIPFRVSGEPLISVLHTIYGFGPFVSKGDKPSFDIVCTEDVEFTDITETLYEFEAEGVTAHFCKTFGGYILNMVDEQGMKINLMSDTKKRTVYLKGAMEPMMLRTALWISYGLMTVDMMRILIHSSCIVNSGKAYLFLGESGTGKSTHTRLWRENIQGSVLLNDDSPVLAFKDGKAVVYGSPWSGKTPCYKQECYPLGGVVRLSQAPYNKIEKLSVLKAYAAMHPSCPPAFSYDDELYNGVCSTLDKVISNVNVYHLSCLPDAAAAELSFNTITRNEI